MLFGLGMPEVLIILVLALIIFGPKNLPKLGSTLGKTVKEIRSSMDDETNDTNDEKTNNPEITTEATTD